jgi:quercetin dioxygenase-like cupin family protein
VTSDRGTKRRQRGITIYRASEGVPLQETDFMSAPEMSPGAGAGFGGALTAGLGAGGMVDVVVRQDEAEGGFSLVRLWFKANYPLVRHTHDADCLYYVLSGTAVMGNQTLHTGDSFFVPANAPYRYNAGPEGVEILEIRHGVEQFNMVIPDEPESRWQAMAEAAASNRDAWEAMTENPTLAANRS